MGVDYEIIGDEQQHKETRQNRMFGVVGAICCVALLAGWSSKGSAAAGVASLDAVPMNPESLSSAKCITSDEPVLAGVDVVAYFSLSEGDSAVTGSEEHTATFGGYSFYFSSAANRKAFELDPAKYAPQWGSFCSYGISSETFWTWDAVENGGPEADPNVWLIRDDKLYLFMYEVPKRKFLEGNVDERIESGMATWDTFTSGSIHDYFNTACFWYDAECGHDGDICISEYDALMAAASETQAD